MGHALLSLPTSAGACLMPTHRQLDILLLPSYGHYTGQPALAKTPVKNREIMLDGVLLPK